MARRDLHPGGMPERYWAGHVARPAVAVVPADLKLAFRGRGANVAGDVRFGYRHGLAVALNGKPAAAPWVGHEADPYYVAYARGYADGLALEAVAS